MNQSEFGVSGRDIGHGGRQELLTLRRHVVGESRRGETPEHHSDRAKGNRIGNGCRCVGTKGFYRMGQGIQARPDRLPRRERAEEVWVQDGSTGMTQIAADCKLSLLLLVADDKGWGDLTSRTRSGGDADQW